ncbi:MAG: site-specific tyrosine recombinase XerD [Rhodoglobus sp.]
MTEVKRTSAGDAIAVAAERYLRHVAIERGLSSNTLAAYRRDLQSYRSFLSNQQISTPAEITAAQVTGYAHSLRANPERALAASSVARMLSTVRGLHAFCLEESLVTSDVAHDVAIPKQLMRLPKAITIQQMATVLAAFAGDDVISLRNTALLELLYATGARVSEVVSLDVDHMIDGDIVRLLGKGNKERIVPVGRFAQHAVSTYLVRSRPALSVKGPATPALFLGARGARLSRQNVWLIIQDAAERANLGIEISPHTFRHSFATHVLSGGADVRVVQELLGHSSVATTQIYTQVTADNLRDMYTTAHPRAR